LHGPLLIVAIFDDLSDARYNEENEKDGADDPDGRGFDKKCSEDKMIHPLILELILEPRLGE
jgi:hypothetical protein